MTSLEVTVTSGVGIASTLPVDGLRFPAHPGTLNVLATTPAEFGEADGQIDPWYHGPAPFRYGTFGGIEVAVLGAIGQVEAGWQLELIAPVHLRDTLGLDDGDIRSLTA